MVNEKINNVQKEFGVPAGNDVKRKPKNEKYLVSVSGDATFVLGSVAWPKEGSLEEYEDPEPVFYANARGYSNSKGFPVQISLSGDIESLDNMIRFYTNVKEFVQKTGIDITKADYSKDDLEAALIAFKPKK
ncbi:MAG: hypothetical protein M0P07_05080 [Candidatus Methanomethylophilaceae archaeon]|nr:hypothetical protein [Candidatus Methanomethylophilaceae archaeon]